MGWGYNLCRGGSITPGHFMFWKLVAYLEVLNLRGGWGGGGENGLFCSKKALCVSE